MPSAYYGKIPVVTQYNATAPSIADTMGAYLMVDSAGRVIAVGPVAAGSAIGTSSPLQMGLSDGTNVQRAQGRTAVPADLDVAQVTWARLYYKDQAGNIRESGGINVPLDTDGAALAIRTLSFATAPLLRAPAGTGDMGRGASDTGPGKGAQLFGMAGGDQNLKASTVETASGTSTALSNEGWVKSFAARLNVTAASGTTPTLDVYIQTQKADGGWHDIVHFTQRTATGVENVTWGPVVGGTAGTQAEGAAVTVDNFFADEDAVLAATTIRLMTLGAALRVKWVIGGTTPSFTFAVTSTLKG